MAFVRSKLVAILPCPKRQYLSNPTNWPKIGPELVLKELLRNDVTGLISPRETVATAAAAATAAVREDEE